MKVVLLVRRQPWARALKKWIPKAARTRLLALASEENGFQRTAAWNQPANCYAFNTPSHVDPQAAGQGVNIFGYLRGQFGLGESAREYARALIGQGYPVAAVDIELDIPHSQNDHSLDAWIGQDAPYAASIIFVNPDYFAAASEYIGEARLRGRYLIACWFWELEDIPQEWMPTIDLVDELMVASEFVENAFRKVTNKPILRAPLPLNALPDSALSREDFGIEAGKFVFLCSFDFNSWVARKNPFAVVDAFRRAFPPDRNDVCLLIKTSNGFRYPMELRAILDLAARDPRIVVRDDIIERPHFIALQRNCDAYVSLHRAEGFGLGMAECMVMGKPVIATGWSGNLEFMNAETACLVDYALVPVEPGQYPHAQGACWAEPDVDCAASWMRKLADDRAFAQAVGERGRAAAASLLAPQKVAARIAARIEELSRSHNDIRRSSNA